MTQYRKRVYRKLLVLLQIITAGSTLTERPHQYQPTTTSQATILTSKSRFFTELLLKMCLTDTNVSQYWHGTVEP